MTNTPMENNKPIAGYLSFADSGETVPYYSADELAAAYKREMFSLGAYGVHFKDIADNSLKQRLTNLYLDECGISDEDRRELRAEGFDDSPIPQTNTFEIHQTRNDMDEARNFRFAPMHELEKNGLVPNQAYYKLVYTSQFDENLSILATIDKRLVLERIFEMFNAEIPLGYTGRSVSVSDVIVLRVNGGVSAHFVDSIGFAEIDGFFADSPMGEKI
jgi:hypothetical protein